MSNVCAWASVLFSIRMCLCVFIQLNLSLVLLLLLLLLLKAAVRLARVARECRPARFNPNQSIHQSIKQFGSIENEMIGYFNSIRI